MWPPGHAGTAAGADARRTISFPCEGRCDQPSPLRFEGHYYDPGIRHYDMKARTYRPEAGRFLTADRFESARGDLALQSDPLTQNRYAFAGGNPVNLVEWDGRAPRAARL